MSRHLIDRCEGKWREVLAALGVPASLLSGKPGPCPMCGGKDRFVFDNRKPKGSGSWFCRQQCGSGYGVHLAMKVNGWTFKQAADAIEQVLAHEPVGASPDCGGASPTENSKSDLSKARSIWEGGTAIQAEASADRYLSARGLVPPGSSVALRQHSRLVYFEDGEFVGWFPALIALVRSAENKPVAVHRTFLTSDGRKADVPAPRKLLGTLPDGAAVRLAEQTNILGIAEGIETALSATALFGIPCWSAINANGLEKWTPPADVREVVIFGDNDRKFRGQAAAFALAHRLTGNGLAVRVEIPTEGKDWNVVLIKRGAP